MNQAQNSIKKGGVVRLDALLGLSAQQRAELHRRVARHVGQDAIGRRGARPSALGLTGSIDLVCVPLRTNLAQDQAASIVGISPGHRVPALGPAAHRGHQRSPTRWPRWCPR